MDRVDDLLDGDDSGDQDTPSQNRSAAETRIERDKAKLQKEIEELRSWKAEREQADRTQSVAATFSELGLNPKHAQFYQGQETTTEAVRAWAVEQEFLSVDNQGETAPAAPPEVGFTPTTFGEGQHLGARFYTF